MKKGEFIRLEFTAWVKEPRELFDTTDEKIAREEGKYVEGAKYGPIVTVVGEGKLLPGLDEALLDAEVGEEKEVEIPPEKAYGVRNPNLIEMHSLRELMRLPEFRKGDEMPAPGMEVTLGGRKGVITTLAAGRARIDFNHPYAGKTFIYRFKVLEVVEDPVERVRALIRLNYGREEDFGIELKENGLEITLPEIAKLDYGWVSAKLGLISDIRRLMDFKEIRFIEKYPGKKRAEETEEEGEKVEGGEEEKKEGEEPEGADKGKESEVAEEEGEQARESKGE